MSNVKKHTCIRFILYFLLLFFCLFLIVLSFQTGFYIAKRNHGDVVIRQCVSFSETSDQLNNPNRGFYYIYGFRITDKESIDYDKVVSEKMIRSQEQSIAMVQINLQEYATGEISEKGLHDIEAIFSALKTQNKQYLIRFLYDWDGNNLQVEPKDVNIITTHMQQLSGILHDYKDIIFVHQGIFIGNWGEMNGTVHLEHMKLLAQTLRKSLHEDTFMAVRMPAQWRKITETASPQIDDWNDDSIAHKLSLFNDGIMGNYGDYGTYGTQSRSEVGDFTHWNREEELAFQEILCRYVPNGGEVIVDNEYNDFENALKNLRTMHITYLNYDYDRNVLQKWENEIINDGSVYQGMDGLTYIDRHLGYRLLIDNVSMNYNYMGDSLSLCINMKNVGFAPIYKDTTMHISLVNEDTGETYSYLVEGNLSKLSGGNESEILLGIEKEIVLLGYAPGTYKLFFSIIDADSAMPILLANEQIPQNKGYELGKIFIEEMKLPFIN